MINENCDDGDKKKKEDYKNFQDKIRRTEMLVLEGDLGYVPDPNFIEIKCEFIHKRCKTQPAYMDKRDNRHYCFVHKTMISHYGYK